MDSLPDDILILIFEASSNLRSMSVCRRWYDVMPRVEHLDLRGQEMEWSFMSPPIIWRLRTLRSITAHWHEMGHVQIVYRAYGCSVTCPPRDAADDWVCTMRPSGGEYIRFPEVVPL